MRVRLTVPPQTCARNPAGRRFSKFANQILAISDKDGPKTQYCVNVDEALTLLAHGSVGVPEYEALVVAGVVQWQAPEEVKNPQELLEDQLLEAKDGAGCGQLLAPSSDGQACQLTEVLLKSAEERILIHTGA